MNRPFLIHLGFMLLSYALAVLVATTIACFLFGLPTILPDDGRWGSFYTWWRDFPSMLVIGGMMTAIYGFPGWLISVVIAERRNFRSRRFFAIAGGLTALLALLIAGRFQGLFPEISLNLACLAGGFCGGLAYWTVAGKQSGAWRSPI
jgi:hypothetical protein